MKRKTVLLAIVTLFLTAFGLPAKAQVVNDAGFCLVLTTKDGGKTLFAFIDRPEVTIVERKFNIITVQTAMEYKASDIVSFVIEQHKTPSSISDLQAMKPAMHLSAGQMSMTGCRPGSEVFVYSADGRMADSRKADDQGMLTLNLRTYGQGTFIVKTAHTSFKVNNK